MAKKITDKVSWVGKIDWELKMFHGEELSTRLGSSYNAYLIKDKKNVLIDTVWLPYDKEFVTELKREIDLMDIDYIILNHAEVDHSGSLEALLREIPDVPIYCTANGEKIMRGHYHKDWNFVNVKTGDTLNIGESTLTFIEARMMHWPDTMFTYMSGDNILFSTDGFGQHYASESLFAEKDSLEVVMNEAIKYYTNILNPYSPLVAKKLEEIKDLNLPIDYICPSHGVIWKEQYPMIIEAYEKWSKNYQENQITIVYDTMWESTRKMAESITRGIQSVDREVTIKLLHAGKADKNDILTEIFKSKTVLFGSSTVNNGLLHGVSGILELAKGLKFGGKSAACFGSYGWSGECVALLNSHVKDSGFNMLNDGMKIQWVPDAEGIALCEEFGRSIIKG